MFQPKAATAPAAAGKAAPAPNQPAKGKELPKPEDVSLETRDGVSLKATFYPGTAKKESVPIIMIHGFEGQRGDYHSLALYLQSLGHASIAPDLRGHGQSKASGMDPDKLTKLDLEAMVYDIQACKKFLLEKNNAGELNIEELCVIGADFGAILAVRWAAADWSLQDLPAYKQGKDVKALVLLSAPPAGEKGVTMREALMSPAIQSLLSIMFVAGVKDTKAANEAKKLYKSLQTRHPKPSDDDRLKTQELFLVEPETSLRGTKLLGAGSRVPQDIAKFIDLRLVNRKAEFAWQDRKNPLGN